MSRRSHAGVRHDNTTYSSGLTRSFYSTKASVCVCVCVCVCVHVCNFYLTIMNAVKCQKRSRPLTCFGAVWIIVTLLVATADASADGCDWTGRLISFTFY